MGVNFDFRMRRDFAAVRFGAMFAIRVCDCKLLAHSQI